jgi:spore germination cell wall hydrolase CwlJ-like protein
MKKLIPAESQDKRVLSADLSTELSIYTLARTIYGEARGEGPAGMRAVAAVIMNRVRAPGWWGGDIESVCRKKMQFSCWNENDFNRPIIEAADESDPVFATALRIARRAAASVLDDPTGGATHYHAAGISPAWARGQKPTAVIGHHIFYRLI